MAAVDTPWRNSEGADFTPQPTQQTPAPTEFAPLSRRTALAGGAGVLAAMALSACSAVPPPEVASLQPTSSQPPASPLSQTMLRELLDRAPPLVVSGAPLDAALLKRFYARHEFAPVWDSRPAQADVLIAAVQRAGEHGLSPALFHAALLRDPPIAPLEHELLLSNAFLTYADALARGAVPVEHRKDDQVLAPEPLDVAALLDAAVASPDPAGAIEALAPTTPTYAALRQALPQAQQLARTGPLPGRKAAANRLRMIAVNLERQRWLPRPLPPDRAWVNVADERLVLYRAGQPVFATRVVVGEDVQKNQSPEFRATIDASFYNPPWVIPVDIARAEIMPKLDTDPDYLTRNRMVVLANGEIEQHAGPDAGLGYIMFDMPNRFDVYLHDTPDRDIFNRDNRRISHGCIRVQNPRDFAALLMDKPIEAIDQGIAAGNTTRNDLAKPVPVLVVYQTAFEDADGTLQFRPDFYRRDAEIWQSLQRRAPTPAFGALPRTAKADRRAAASL